MMGTVKNTDVPLYWRVSVITCAAAAFGLSIASGQPYPYGESSKGNMYSISTSTGISPSNELATMESLTVKSAGVSVSALRELTGLSANQLGRLFGVSRRSINNWISGMPMAEQHSNRLAQLQQIVMQLPSSSAAERKANLLDSSKGMSLFHQLVRQIPSGEVIQGDALSARNQLAV